MLHILRSSPWPLQTSSKFGSSGSGHTAISCCETHSELSHGPELWLPGEDPKVVELCVSTDSSLHSCKIMRAQRRKLMHVPQLENEQTEPKPPIRMPSAIQRTEVLACITLWMSFQNRRAKPHCISPLVCPQNRQVHREDT